VAFPGRKKITSLLQEGRTGRTRGGGLTSEKKEENSPNPFGKKRKEEGHCFSRGGGSDGGEGEDGKFPRQKKKKKEKRAPIALPPEKKGLNRTPGEGDHLAEKKKKKGRIISVGRGKKELRREKGTSKCPLERSNYLLGEGKKESMYLAHGRKR